MGIYTPYTYLIGWSEYNVFYYGRRTAKNCHPSELWVRYFTSSKIVKKFRLEYGDPDIIQIRKTFVNSVDCAKWESSVLRRLDAQHNQKFLNQKNGDEKWDTTGLVPVQTLAGDRFCVAKDDPRLLSGEIAPCSRNNRGNLGNVHTKEARAKMSAAQENRIITDEYRKSLSVAATGKPKSKTHAENIAAAKRGNTNVRGKKWFTNGTENTMAFECPIGFYRGRC